MTTSRRTRASRSPTDRSIRTARAATSRSRSPVPTATSACRTASGSSATSSAGTRRSARRSSRCACPIRTRRTPTRTTGSSARRPSSCGDIVLEANYIGNVGRNFGRLVDYNTVRGDLFDGRLDRLNPSFGGINYRAMLARSEYHGLQLQVNKRFTRRLLRPGVVHARQGDGRRLRRAGRRPAGRRARLDLEWGPSDFDVRHRLVINWLWELPFFRDAARHRRARCSAAGRSTASPQLQSGFPFNVITNAQLRGRRRLQRRRRQQRPAEPAVVRPGAAATRVRQAYINGLFVAADFPRPDVLGTLPRNAYRGPGFASTDLSFFKDFRLPCAAPSSSSAPKCSTCSTASTCSARTATWRRPRSDESTQSFAAREIQLALKLIF